MTLDTIRLNRLARSASLVLLDHSICHDHKKVKRVVYERMKKFKSRMVKTAKQNSNNPAEMVMELSTDIAMKLLEEVPEIYKFEYVANIHGIIQNLFDRLYKNILRGEQRGAPTKGKNKKAFSS